MSPDPFLEDDFRVLTPEAFNVVLTNELKRAVRSQSYLTLLLVEPRLREPVQDPVDASTAPEPEAEREAAVRQIARLVSREVRETDLLSQTAQAQLSVVLLDADLQNSLRVVDRFMARLEHYQFARPLAIGVGAASCPTHGADAETLRRSAQARTVHHQRDVDATPRPDSRPGWDKSSNAQ
jgi:GGDEF domain-containing protein